MTQKDKELLLCDLSARLPYGIICQMEDKLIINDSPFYNHTLSERHIELFRNHKGFYIKPYLRPMSSMTEEEKKELLQISNFNYEVDEIYDGSIHFIERAFIDIVDIVNFINWLNAHHFDYRGLIEKGLAIEAPKDMYKID